MSRQNFIHDLAWALSHLRISTRSKDPLGDPRWAENDEARAAFLLRDVRLKDYQPNDFVDLTEADQATLREAVWECRRSAQEALSGQPLGKERIEAWIEALRRIRDVVRKPILQEWSAAVEALVADAEGWSWKHGWSTKRESKEIDEAFLETYEVPKLLFHANGATLVVDPVARFAMGAEGVAELAVVPSYDHMVLPRTIDEGWRILSDESARVRTARLDPWNEGSFVQAVSYLKTLQ